MAISQEVASSDVPSLVEAGQTFDANLEDDGTWPVEYAAKALAIRWCAVDVQQRDVAHDLLFGPSYFAGNSEPLWKLFDSMRTLFIDNARTVHAADKDYTVAEMAKKAVITALDAYGRQSWFRLLKAQNNSVTALCLEQSPPLEFIEPKKPANPESEARKKRKEANMSDADRAEADAKKALAKALKANCDDLRMKGDSSRTDILAIRNVGTKAYKDGDTKKAAACKKALAQVCTLLTKLVDTLNPDPQS